MNIYKLLSLLFSLAGIPIAVFIGFFGADKSANAYYFTALALVALALASFVLGFEGRKPKTAEIVIVSVLAAIAVCGRMAFYMIPQFKPMLAVIVISGICFGKNTGCLTGVISAFVSNFLFGQGPLTPWQMLGFGLCGYISGILLCGNGNLRIKLRSSRLFVCAFGGFLAFCPYGLIINPAAAVILYRGQTTLGEIAASYISGFSFDAMHCLSTILFLFVLYNPVVKKLNRIKLKYAMMETHSNQI